jgi:hypothetical protein
MLLLPRADGGRKKKYAAKRGSGAVASGSTDLRHCGHVSIICGSELMRLNWPYCYRL